MRRPHVSAFTLVTKADKLLLILRKDPPFSRTWSLPGGHLEFGETIEKAAVREVREETGIRIRILRTRGFENLVFTDAGKPYHIVLFRFVGVPTGGRLRKGRDVAGAAWVRKRELTRLRLSRPARDFLQAEGLIRARGG
jgi:8-oxo-dGTP diphosphatase